MLYLRARPFVFLLHLVVVVVLGGCAITAPPTPRELSAIDADKSTLLLLRVAVTIEGKAYEPFLADLPDDNVGIGLGTFETAGKVRVVEPQRFFSEDARARGWTYLSVPRGTLYLSFLPPRRTDLFTYHAMFDRTQLWRIDVPERAKVVYAGTLAIEGEGIPLLFGGQRLEAFTRVEIRDEREAAQLLVDEYVPQLGKIETILMRRYY